MNKQSATAILRTQAVVLQALDALESELLATDPHEFDAFRRLYGKLTRRIWGGSAFIVNAPIQDARDELH